MEILSRFSGQILKEVTSNRAAVVGSLLDDLMLTVQSIDIEKLSNPGLIARVWHKILAEVSLFNGNFERVITQIDYLLQQLDEVKGLLLEDSKKLQQTYVQNISHLEDLEVLIRAAEEAIIKAPPDSYTSMEFEKRIEDLKLSQALALQTLPLCRLIQQNNNELVTKIQSSISNQMVLTLSLKTI